METDPNILKLADKDFKTTIIIMLKNLKDNMFLMNK